MAGRHPLPILVSDAGPTVLLERVPLAGGSGASAYDEKWLQELLYKHPQALPVAEINPSFNGLIPICREMLTPAGPVDVLYATAEGRIAVLEAKLWRNPEARRKVVGQILDYAKELSHWTYETLNAAVLAARRRDQGTARSLFEVVSEKHPELDEAQFIDAISRSLRLGDLLLVIAGDGIRENVGAITSFIEDHGTLHFTFGLVEMAIFRMPDGKHLVQPRVLAHSEVIRRIVVEVRGSQIEEAGAEASDDADDSGPRPDLEKRRQRYAAFWTELLQTYPLDDANQPVRPPAIGTNQFYSMPDGSGGRVSAFLALAEERAGVYLHFGRTPVADRIYAALFEDRAELDKSIGTDDALEWKMPGADWQGVIIRREFGPDILTKRRSETQQWLGDRVNRFVSIFRPRIESLLREE